MIIFNLICLPNNDYRYSLDQIYEKNKGIKIININLTEIFFLKANLKKYEQGSNHNLKKEISFKTKKSFKEFIIKNFISKKHIYCLSNFYQVDDFWILRFFKKYDLSYFIGYKTNPLPYKEKRISVNYIKVFYKYLFMFRLKLIFKINILKYFHYYKKPDFLITSGSSDHYWNKNKLNVPIIKIPSPQIRWDIKSKRGKNVIFVDEFRFFRRDTHLYGITGEKINTLKYYQELNRFFSFIEKKFKSKIIICCSNKHRYKKNLFNNRKIIYGKTLEYIAKSKIVIGHNSDALFQAIYNKKKIIIFNPINVENLKKLRIQNFAKFFNLSLVNEINYLNNIQDNIKIIDNSSILKKYFCENSYTSGKWKKDFYKETDVYFK